MQTPNSAANSSSQIAVVVIGTGEMGSAVAKRLLDRGSRVRTSLRGRSAESRARIEKLGIPHVDDDVALIDGIDVLLSIVPPEEAVAVAQRFAGPLRALSADKRPIFVDCNAVSPQTAERVAEVVQGAGGEFVDGGITGSAPRDGYAGPIIWVSGPQASRALALREAGLEIRVAGDSIGDASAIKLSYAGITKGTFAIGTTMILAAMRHGQGERLIALLRETIPGLFEHLRGIERIPPKAYRFVREMQEIAEYTQAPQSIGPEVYSAAAKLWEWMASEYPADESGVLQQLADVLKGETAGAKI